MRVLLQLGSPGPSLPFILRSRSRSEASPAWRRGETGSSSSRAEGRARWGLSLEISAQWILVQRLIYSFVNQSTPFPSFSVQGLWAWRSQEEGWARREGPYARKREVIRGFRKLVLSLSGSLVFMEQNRSNVSFSTPALSQGIFPLDSPGSVNATTLRSGAQSLKLGVVFAFFLSPTFHIQFVSTWPEIRARAIYLLLPILSGTPLIQATAHLHRRVLVIFITGPLRYLLLCSVCSSCRSKNDL